MNADNTPCANCQINFNPPNNRPQIVGGTSVNPQAAYTTTDSNGNLAAISLIQGTLMVVTIQNPASGGYSAGIAAAVPFNVGTTFTQLLAQNNLAPGTSTVNGLSVGTRTLTHSGSPYTSLVTDFILACDASGGNVVYDLPASSGGGRWLELIKVDSSSNTCTLTPNGADTINGATTQSFSTQYTGLLFNDTQLGKWLGLSQGSNINGNVNGVLNAMAPPYNAVGDGTTDDTTALQTWLTAVCAAPAKAGYLPTPSVCYKTTATLNLTCGAMIQGADWTGGTSGVPHGPLSVASYLTGSIICPAQTSGVAFMVAATGQQFFNNGGDLKNIAFAGFGNDGATQNISTISEVYNNTVGSTVTVTLPGSIGLAQGTETGLIVKGVTPTYTLSGTTETAASGGTVTATATIAHGMTIPADNVTLTITGSSVTGYNTTGAKLQAVGPCAKTSITCGVRAGAGDFVLNGTTTVTSATAAFAAPDVGAAVQIFGGLATTGTLVTTIASVTNSTTAVLTSCGTGCATATGKTGIVYMALLNTQFQYNVSGTGLGAGSGGTITEVGNDPGGLTYSKPVMATVGAGNTLTYYLPYSGLGTMTSTGTAQLTTIGVLIGDAGTALANKGGYTSAFNTDHLGVYNFGLGIGFLEQNALHNGLTVDLNVTQLFDEFVFNAENDVLEFNNFQTGASYSQYNVDWSAYSSDTTFINAVLEDPNHDDPTSANVLMVDGQRDTWINQYNNPSDGLPSGDVFTGEGFAVLGAYNAEGTKIDGGFFQAGANSHVDIHVYQGSDAMIENIRAYDTVILGTLSFGNVLLSDNIQALTDNTVDSLVIAEGGASGGPQGNATFSGTGRPTFASGLDISGGNCNGFSGLSVTVSAVPNCIVWSDGTFMKFGARASVVANIANGQVGIVSADPTATTLTVGAPAGFVGRIEELGVNSVTKQFTDQAGNLTNLGTHTVGAASGTNGAIIFNGSTSGSTTVQANVAAGGTLTLPTGTGTLCVSGTPCAGVAVGITSHTLTGATPVAVVASATVPAIDVENLLLSANVTSYTLPAANAMADGEILHVFIRQSVSGGPWTLPSATVGPFTAGSGSIVIGNSAVTCPTIGTTQSATVPSELHASIVYEAALTEWVVESCVGVR